MIPADQLQSLLFGGPLGGAKIIRGNRKAIARGIVAPIGEREKRAHLAAFRTVTAQQGAAGLVRIIPGTIAADTLGDL